MGETQMLRNLASLKLLALGLSLAILPGCKKTPDTQVVVTLTSDLPVDDIAIMVRNIRYDIDRIIIDVRGRNLASEPYTVQIRPSPAINDKFLFYARGLRNGDVLVAESMLLEFKENETVTASLAMRDDFVDADGDGFEPCLRPGCDCDDRNPTVNPFTEEKCDDFVDNNCSGFYRDNCPCLDTDPPVPCSGLPTELRHLAGIGACYLGELLCIDGVLQSMEHCDYGAPGAEIANNFTDDDCDGSVDEGSPCMPGASRPCHRGFVDDPAHPDPAQRLSASQLALGECRNSSTDLPWGVQICEPSGVWGRCEGDVLPERNHIVGVGWAERIANVAQGDPGQCDGLDNDCDGQYDEEPWFDADGDGYTSCGTIFVPHPEDPTKNAFTQPGLAEEFIDCNDANPNINPGQVEVCGNNVDEDCRCDHDPNGLAQGVAGSVIGQPYNRFDGATNCPSNYAALNCSVLPRSDAHPTGICDDQPTPFYAGYFGPTITHQNCYGCTAVFGQTCDLSTGACTSKAQDCEQCSHPGPPPDTALVVERPNCTVPGTGCVGDTPPQWLSISGIDPNNDCPGHSCAGYFYGIVQGQCFEKADQLATAVVCKGGGECETPDDRCPFEVSPKSQAVPPPGGALCRKAVAGCTGQTPPLFDFQDNNEDLLDQCTDAFTCNDSQPANGGGPFYYGIEPLTAGGANLVCYFRANISNSACNGAGSCQTRTEACSTSGRGAVVPGRPNCHMPASGTCQGQTEPTYDPVPAGNDPYEDCPAGLTCNGLGACYVPLGEPCSAAFDGLCLPGLSCVDGVCCNVSECPACHACNVTGQLGSCQPISGVEGNLCDGPCTYCNNGTCLDRSAGDYAECTDECTVCDGGTGGSGVCVAHTGSNGPSCEGDTNFCCAGVCNTPLGTAGTPYGSPCGSGACVGTWGCTGTTGLCSAFNAPCESCDGDTRILGVCTNNLGTSCNTSNTAACPACSSCRQSGATTSCDATQGEHPYYQNEVDDNAPNLCAPQGEGGGCGAGLDCACDGAGNCRRGLGEACDDAGQCASGACVNNVCCSDTACGLCERCDVPYFEGNCFPASGPQVNCDQNEYCCSGECVEASGFDYGDQCGNPGCLGAWGCFGIESACVVPDPYAICTECDGSACMCDGEPDPTCKKAPGQSCTSPDECASGLCSENECAPLE